MKKNNKIVIFCIRTGIIFSVITFIIVISGCVMNKVELGVIIKRLFIAELIFFPMGVLVGFILTNVLNNVLFDTGNSVATAQKTAAEESLQENGVTADSGDEESSNLGNNLDIRDEPVNPDDIPLDTPPRDYSSTGAASQNSEYIMVNDKKIVNDPKVLAEAVKTMINEG